MTIRYLISTRIPPHRRLLLFPQPFLPDASPRECPRKVCQCPPDDKPSGYHHKVRSPKGRFAKAD
ncbi:MAG: hypothetical protein ACOYYI_07455 [Chloroflexota bacterium]